MKKISSIRCPADRKHKTSAGKEYPTCGHLLIGYDENYLFVRCPICKIFWKVNLVNAEAAEMEQVSKQEELQLNTVLRLVQ